MFLTPKVKFIYFYRILFPIIFLFVLVSCITSMKPERDFIDSTYKDKYVYWISVYNEQFNFYIKLIESPNLSEEEIVMLNIRKKHLPDIYSLLEIYQVLILDDDDNGKNLTAKQQTLLLEFELDVETDYFENEISHTIFELIIKLYPDD